MGDQPDVWAELLGASDCPYDITLSSKKGGRFEAPPPFPDLKILAVKSKHVRRIVFQEVDVEARADERDKVKRYRVRRLVADMEGDTEVELSREVLPAQLLEDLEGHNINTSVCGACGGNIPRGDHILIESVAYHRRCVE